MKKICTIAISLCLLFMVCFFILPSEANAATSGYYTYEISNGEATITDCNTSISGAITIPSTLGGYPVTTVGYRAFIACVSLTSVTIPDSVTAIGDYAFDNCSSLESITIPDSVITIGYRVFAGCTSLTSVTIPDSVTAIGDYAFDSCTSLTSVTIPDSITAIGDYAFDNCSSLESITIPDSVITIGYRVFDGCTSLKYAIYDNGMYLGNDQNPYMCMINAISDEILSCQINPDTKIIANAFWNCTSLTSITIPDGVITIGSSAFQYCSSLTSVTIPDSVTAIGEQAFYSCTSLTSVTIPDSVTVIGNGAFTRCASLTSVTIPDSVTAIGDDAFQYCSSLTSVTIPDSITAIGDDAFYNCSSLNSVHIKDIAAWCSISFYDDQSNPLRYANNLYLNGKLVNNLVIPDSVTTIGQYAVDGCTSLISVAFPRSLTTVGGCAFSGCKNLEKVYCCDQDAWNNIYFEVVEKTIWDCMLEWTEIDYSSNPLTLGAELVIHSWVGGNCNTPATCAICGNISEEYVHTWIEATCITSRYCFVCGITEGEALGHSWVEATCTTPKTCSVCGESEGSALGHSWQAATCTTPKTCTVCGKSEGSALGHSWQAATCTTPKTCLTCGETKGSALGHSWNVTTCTTSKTCTACGAIGNPVAHAYSNADDAVCNVCGESRILTDPNLKFYGNPGLSFQDYIGIQILLQNSKVTDYDEVYVVAVQETPDGDVTTTSYGRLYATKYTLFEQKIISWSMTEKVTITLYGKKGTSIYQGDSFTTSVKQLALEKLATYWAQNSLVRCRALVDMLNYGTVVQTTYGRNTDNLPNADLGQYASLGSNNEPLLSAQNTITGVGAINVRTHNISLQEKVEIQFLFTTDISSYKAVATSNGTEVEVEIDTEIYASRGYTLVKIPIATKDLRNIYTFALYDSSGKPVTQVYNVSVEGYANARKDTTKHIVDVALMRYGDSIIEVFNGN